MQGRRKRVSDGQVDFIGQVHNMTAKTKPRVVRFPNGLAIVASVVLHDSLQIDREFILSQASEMARRSRINPKYYIKKS